MHAGAETGEWTTADVPPTGQDSLQQAQAALLNSNMFQNPGMGDFSAGANK